MREIKFRAFDKVLGMREVALIDFVNQTLYVIDDYGNQNELSFINSPPLQYTGLQDKNGKEIYEGDIMEGWIVSYCGNQNEGLGMNAGWYLQKDDFASWAELDSRLGDGNHEVIGNVYENPELLVK